MLFRIFSFGTHRINAKWNKKKKGQGHVQQKLIPDTCKARYTLFANNDEASAKWQKNYVLWIVYSRCSPCFTNRFFTAHCLQDLHRGGGLCDRHKGVFCQKKILKANMFARKLTTNNEWCIVAHSPCFCEQYFVRWKNCFIPYLSCSRIVYSGVNDETHAHAQDLKPVCTTSRLSSSYNFEFDRSIVTPRWMKHSRKLSGRRRTRKAPIA